MFYTSMNYKHDPGTLEDEISSLGNKFSEESILLFGVIICLYHVCLVSPAFLIVFQLLLFIIWLFVFLQLIVRLCLFSLSGFCILAYLSVCFHLLVWCFFSLNGMNACLLFLFVFDLLCFIFLHSFVCSLTCLCPHSGFRWVALLPTQPRTAKQLFGKFSQPDMIITFKRSQEIQEQCKICNLKVQISAAGQP